MKAAVYTRYGSPDVLQIMDVPTPEPKDNEILIRQHASAVTPSDAAMLTARPLIIRFMNGLRRPKTQILGGAVSGEVVSVGRSVTKYAPGDRVYGLTTTDFGMHAQYRCLPETAQIFKAPAGLTPEDAACVQDALTPIYFLRNMANIRPGQHVLINGASGALGTYGVQIAKILGAEVTGVCSSANVELVKSLGADHVIDYKQADFTHNRDTYDVVFDAVGKSTFGRSKKALKRGGLYLTTVPSFHIIPSMLRTSLFGSKKAKIGFAGLNVTPENLAYLHELITAGKLRTVIDRCYPLEQISNAYRHVLAGHKVGNVVVMMG
jgi:NADPH:quinone reductase-like Zn-dependent oxidoreductase